MILPDGTIKPWRDMTPEEREADVLRHFPTLLGRWRGGRARFWSYTVSHSTLTIRIERAGVRGNLEIYCSADFIHGPVAWEDARIEIGLRPGGGHLIEDRAAGVRVEGYCVAMAEDVKPVFVGS